MRATPPTAVRAPVTFANVAEFAPHCALASAAEGSYDHRWFAPALAAYMHHTASKLHLHPRDVYWVVQTPYAVSAGDFLSSDGPTAGFNSALSMCTLHNAMIVECLFLEAEHEFLEVSTGAAATGAVPSASQSLLQSLRDESRTPCPPIDAIPAPDESVANRLQVRTGLQGSCSLAVAIKDVVRVMLRRQRSALPNGLWKAACMRVLRWLQVSLEAMQRRTPDAEASLAQQLQALQQAGGNDPGGGEQRGLPMAAIPAAQLVMTQEMLCEVISTMHETPLKVNLSLSLPCAENIQTIKPIRGARHIAA